MQTKLQVIKRNDERGSVSDELKIARLSFIIHHSSFIISSVLAFALLAAPLAALAQNPPPSQQQNQTQQQQQPQPSPTQTPPNAPGSNVSPTNEQQQSTQPQTVPQQPATVTQDLIDINFPRYDGKPSPRPRMLIDGFLMGGANFFGGDRRIEIIKRFDVPTHRMMTSGYVIYFTQGDR